MKRTCLTALAVIVICAAPTFAQEAKEESSVDVEKQLRENPTVETINEYMRANFSEVGRTIRTDPAKALEILDKMADVMESIEPKEEAAKQLFVRAKDAVIMNAARLHIQHARPEAEKAELDALAKALQGDNVGVDAIWVYGAKVVMDAEAMVEAKPMEAEAVINSAKKLLAALSGKDKDNKAIARAVAGVEQSFGQIEPIIARAKLVGKEAPPMVADVWLNGDALKPEDVKGKVVFIDFWAVWCGPCIGTFPHLIQWIEEYGDKGLVMVGVTGYYGMGWDDENNQIARGGGPVSEQDEQAMLAKFAKHHQLKHLIAVDKDQDMAKYYGVTGIPQVVLIDRAGKIRLIKVGGGPASAKEIEELLKELISQKG